MADAETARTGRARQWMLTGLSGLVSAIALALGTDGWFVPTLAGASAIIAGIGLHRFGRAGSS
jgi:hypothetical protein